MHSTKIYEQINNRFQKQTYKCFLIHLIGGKTKLYFIYFPLIINRCQVAWSTQAVKKMTTLI